jgi:hypothetical protein
LDTTKSTGIHWNDLELPQATTHALIKWPFPDVLRQGFEGFTASGFHFYQAREKLTAVFVAGYRLMKAMRIASYSGPRLTDMIVNAPSWAADGIPA